MFFLAEGHIEKRNICVKEYTLKNYKHMSQIWVKYFTET